MISARLKKDGQGNVYAVEVAGLGKGTSKLQFKSDDGAFVGEANVTVRPKLALEKIPLAASGVPIGSYYVPAEKAIYCVLSKGEVVTVHEDGSITLREGVDSAYGSLFGTEPPVDAVYDETRDVHWLFSQGVGAFSGDDMQSWETVGPFQLPNVVRKWFGGSLNQYITTYLEHLPVKFAGGVMFSSVSDVEFQGMTRKPAPNGNFSITEFANRMFLEYMPFPPASGALCFPVGSGRIYTYDCENATPTIKNTGLPIYGEPNAYCYDRVNRKALMAYARNQDTFRLHSIWLDPAIGEKLIDLPSNNYQWTPNGMHYDEERNEAIMQANGALFVSKGPDYAAGEVAVVRSDFNPAHQKSQFHPEDRRNYFFQFEDNEETSCVWRTIEI